MIGRAVGLVAVLAQVAGGQMPGGVTVPAGTDLYVRLAAEIGSESAKLDAPFEAAVLADVRVGEAVAVPAGAVVRGMVASVRAAALMQRSSLTLAFETVRVGDRDVRLRAVVLQAFDPKMREEAWRASGTTGPVVGGPGLLAGVLVAQGGTMSTAGPGDVRLPAGTVLRIRLSRPIEFPAAIRPQSPSRGVSPERRAG